MKFAVSLTLAAATALPAMAQSNVTVYGVVDAYGQYLNGVSRLSRMQSGGLSGSRLGFRGVEDLGGGLRAVFTLESGFNVDEGTIGQGGAFFGRQSYVGLQGSWGALTAGRQYSSVYHATNDFSVFGNGPVGPSTAVIGGFGGGYEPVRGASATATAPAAGATGNGGPARINNSLRYESPSWGGLRVSALVGAGEVSGGTSDSRVLDLGLRYAVAGFDVVLSVVDDRALVNGAKAADARTVSLASSYNFAPFRVVAGVLHFDDKRSASLDGRGWWVGGDWRVDSHTVKAQHVLNKPRFGSDNETKSFGVGYGYELSKRTQLYSSLTRFENDSNAGVGGLGRVNAGLPSNITRAGDNSVSELVLGVRHSF